MEDHDGDRKGNAKGNANATPKPDAAQRPWGTVSAQIMRNRNSGIYSRNRNTLRRNRKAIKTAMMTLRSKHKKAVNPLAKKVLEETIQKYEDLDRSIAQQGATTACTKKGAQCSVKGKAYEIEIAEVCRRFRSPHMDILFNTQKDAELGGCCANNDIELNWKTERDVGVEVKRLTPDWMQMKLFKDASGNWVGGEAIKIPKESRAIFNTILQSSGLFHGKTPAFLERKITYGEWKDMKKTDPDFKDHYIVCPEDTIARLYRAKGCQYIQIYGKGLYHTGVDICGFGVPFFTCEQRIRIRCKVHKESDTHGFASLSVTAAAQPAKGNLKDLANSPYSLDAVEKMPPQLIRSLSVPVPVPVAVADSVRLSALSEATA